MPGRDGTGPFEAGTMTGGGFGNCIFEVGNCFNKMRNSDRYKFKIFGWGYGNPGRGRRNRFDYSG
jgi:hypothetical protein